MDTSVSSIVLKDEHPSEGDIRIQEPLVEQPALYDRTSLKSIFANDGGLSFIGQSCIVAGWIRTIRYVYRVHTHL